MVRKEIVKPAGPAAAKARQRTAKLAAAGGAERAVSRPESADSADDRMVDAMSLFVRWGRRELHDKTVIGTGIDIDRSAAAILGSLYLHEPVRMSDLAEHLGLDRSTVSRQVAVVVKQGYVRRDGDSSDARAAMLSLTPQGHAVRRKLAVMFHKICMDLIADWKREDRQDFARLLEKLADRFRRDGVY